MGFPDRAENMAVMFCRGREFLFLREFLLLFQREFLLLFRREFLFLKEFLGLTCLSREILSHSRSCLAAFSCSSSALACSI